MEKEKYVYLVETNQLYDNEKDVLYAWNVNNNKIITLLNQQDARIKELEAENNFLEKRNEELMIDRRDFCLERNDLFEENQQLKQSQNQKVIEVLEKLRDYFAIKDTNFNAYDIVADYGDILDWISDKINELRGNNGQQTTATKNH